MDDDGRRPVDLPDSLDLLDDVVHVFEVLFISFGVVVFPTSVLQVGDFARLLGFLLEVAQQEAALHDAWTHGLFEDEGQLEGLVTENSHCSKVISPILCSFFL